MLLKEKQGKKDFPKNNTEVEKWYWRPQSGHKGIFQMSFFDHVTLVHGVGVGRNALEHLLELVRQRAARGVEQQVARALRGADGRLSRAFATPDVIWGFDAR